MVVSLTREFHTARICQFFETVNDFRRISVELFEGGAGDGESHLESSFIFLYKFQQKIVHRKVAQVSDSSENSPIGKIIIVV